MTTTLAVTCPSGTSAGVLTQVDVTSWRVGVVCSGSASSGQFVAFEGCPDGVPMCAQQIPTATDAAVLAWSVVGAWAAVWVVRLLWQSRSISTL